MLLDGVVAALFGVPTLLAGHAVASRLLPDDGAAVRWSALAILGIFAALILFHGLATFDAFSRSIAAAAIVASSALTLAWLRWTPKAALPLLGQDLRAAARALLGDGGAVQGLLRLGLVALVGGVVARALYLPPLGWDSITYHAVKAAQFVQTAGQLTLEMPGGWSFYRYYPPGGEILGAWAMLPFHDDTLYLLVDSVVWLLWAPVLFATARELEIPERLHGPAVLFIMTVPAGYFWVGSGYVDVTLYLLVFAGLLFALRSLNGKMLLLSPMLAMLALVTALTVKITAIAFALATGLVIVARHRRDASALRQVLVGLVGGGLLGLLALLPLLIRNVIEQGHPLSPYGVELLGITLGQMAPGLAWYGHLEPGLLNLERELAAMRLIWGLSGYPQFPNLGFGATFISMSGLIGAVLYFARKPWMTALMAVFAGVQIALYFSPAFAVVRMGWAGTSGRFLLLFLTICLWLTLASARRERFERPLAGILVGLSLLSPLAYLFTFVDAAELPYLIGGIVGVAAICWLLAFGPGSDLQRATGALLVMAVALIICSPVLREIRDGLRYRLMRDAWIVNRIPPPELSAWASELDDPSHPRQIALTVAPSKHGDRTMLYPFMGARLQNSLHYVSPMTSGEVPVFGGSSRVDENRLSADRWWERLLEQGITHVVVLPPAWHEIVWIRERPDRFETIRQRSTPDGGVAGGVFRVRARVNERE